MANYDSLMKGAKKAGKVTIFPGVMLWGKCPGREGARQGNAAQRCRHSRSRAGDAEKMGPGGAKFDGKDAAAATRIAHRFRQ